MPKVVLTGNVIKGRFGKGSKSAYEAVYLDTGEEKYRLKKKGGNPFFDPSLQKLVGKKIKAKGNLTTYFFEITDDLNELP